MLSGEGATPRKEPVVGGSLNPLTLANKAESVASVTSQCSFSSTIVHVGDKKPPESGTGVELGGSASVLLPASPLPRRPSLRPPLGLQPPLLALVPCQPVCFGLSYSPAYVLPVRAKKSGVGGADPRGNEARNLLKNTALPCHQGSVGLDIEKCIKGQARCGRQLLENTGNARAPWDSVA